MAPRRPGREPEVEPELPLQAGRRLGHDLHVGHRRRASLG
nr:MAG TPA: hypothetical protein [Caudoviricetes sp.]